MGGAVSAVSPASGTVTYFFYKLAHKVLAISSGIIGRLGLIPWWRGKRSGLGLAAGFDKNAEYLDLLQRLPGIGFVEIGTITRFPQLPLPDAGVVRLKDGLWNKLGFPSDGVAAVARRLADFKTRVPSGLLPIWASIGPNRDRLDVFSEDCQYMVSLLDPWVDRFVVNFSSPNTSNLREILKTPFLETLPVPKERTLVKLFPELAEGPLEDFVGQVAQLGFAGVVFSNTRRTCLDGPSVHKLKQRWGGLGGAGLLNCNLQAVERIRKFNSPRFMIVGCGGVMGRSDWESYRAVGAQKVQAYSGYVLRPSLFFSRYD